jgi:hypothetical protein
MVYPHYLKNSIEQPMGSACISSIGTAEREARVALPRPCFTNKAWQLGNPRRKPLENHGKTMETPGKIMGKPGKTIGIVEKTMKKPL